MPLEHEFKKSINKIGLSLLLFWSFMILFMFIQSEISIKLTEILSPKASYIVSDLMYGTAYFCAFFIPGCILYAITKKARRNFSLLEPNLPKAIDTYAYIFASVSIILTIAIINAELVSVFKYSEYSAEYLWQDNTTEPYQIILSFITSAMIPSICEEFLFRGAIFSALMPYGKVPSIIISSVLFGLMHQNAEQFLYATAAGLVLASIVWETKSIWCGVLIHFFNNFIDLFKAELIKAFPKNISYPAFYFIEGAIFVLGILSLAYLIIKKSKKTNKNEQEDPISLKLTAKYFFSPTIILFIVLSLITMLMHIALSIINSVLI